MKIEEKILEQQIARGFFDNAKFAGASGIAKRAVEKGIDTLSPKQLDILKPYLSITCSGITDPGGHYNNCKTELVEEKLLEAIHRTIDTESLICENCDSDQGYYAHQWNKISSE